MKAPNSEFQRITKLQTSKSARIVLELVRRWTNPSFGGDVGVWMFSTVRTIELNIEDIAFGGKGVGRENGKAVFVPFTIEGEKVSAEIVREKKNFAEADLLAVEKPSPHRVEPECPYFGRCGGCSYQHIAYQHQLAIKWHQVRDILQRIGKVKDIPIRPIIPSALSYGYRNRITVHVENGQIGFFRRESHRLIDIERCPISADEVNRALAQLRAQRPRDGHYALRASASGRVFLQTNDAVAGALRELVCTLVPDNQDLLIDAYCGAGFFAKALLDKFQRVIGIDWDRFAIEEARTNSTAKETYIAGDVDLELAKVGAVHPNRLSHESNFASELTKRDPESIRGPSLTLIVDPPRIGLSANVRNAIVELAPETLIYVSCNPATLARDLVELQQNFSIHSVTPLDMFPQTADIEVVVNMSIIPHQASYGDHG